jgi:hypothetical protein
MVEISYCEIGLKASTLQMTATYAITAQSPSSRVAMNEAKVRLLVPCLLLLGVIFCQEPCRAATANTPRVAPPPLTVLMDFEAPHSEASLKALSYSLNKLLSPDGLPVNIQLKADLPANPQFAQLVVFKMKGSCSMDPRLSSARPGTPDIGPLAWAYTSDGQVLHFGEVHCDRVRRSLQRILGFSGSLKNQQTYGSALALVMAHEVYHMLGNATRHTRDGLTKAQLSASELSDSRLVLPPSAVSTLQQAVLSTH